MLVLTMSACMFCGCGKSNKKKSSKETTKETIENSSDVENESISDENNSNTDESLTDDTQNPELDYLFVYDDFLFETYQFIVGMNEETVPSNDQTGIFEALRDEDKDSVLFKVGYCMKDLNDYGITELLIMQINENDSTSYMGSRILATYTYKDNAPANILVGTSRNRYYLFDDNTIFNEGSSGAAYTILGTYTLTKDGSELVAKDFYFSSPINNDYSKIGFFHNTTGDMDTSKSKEFEGSEDDFWKLSTDLSDKIKSYFPMPLSADLANT